MAKQLSKQDKLELEKSKFDIEREAMANYVLEVCKNLQIKFGAGILMGKRIDYLRGKDLNNSLLNHTEEIRTKVLEITENQNDLGKDSSKFLQNFYELLFNKYKLMLKVVKYANDDKLKFPKLLDQDSEIHKFNIFEKEKFYWFNFEKPAEKSKIFLLVILIVSIISIVMFPLWPLNMKFALWYFLMGICMSAVRFLFRLYY